MGGSTVRPKPHSPIYICLDRPRLETDPPLIESLVVEKRQREALLGGCGWGGCDPGYIYCGGLETGYPPGHSPL